MRTYGTYHIENEAILAKMEPMASTRFKRVFERAAKEAAEWIKLKANPENALEFEWFMERYPLAPFDAADEVRLDTLAREFDRRMEMIARITDPGYAPKVVELAIPAREYQLVPNDMLIATGGLLIGDEVGLGKTIMGIIASKECLPALVLTKTDLPKQWRKEFARFTPGLDIAIPGCGKPFYFTEMAGGYAPADLAAEIANGRPIPDVVVTSYSKIAGWAEWIMDTIKPRIAIFDEVQEFRNGTSTMRGAAAKFVVDRVERRLGLSATPIHNSGSEIFNVMEFLCPGYLGDRTEFIREWCYDGNVKEPEVLGSYLREIGVFLRRTKADVGRELPPAIISEQFCEADPKIIASLKDDTHAVELAKYVLGGTRKAFHAAGEFDIMLRQQTGIAKAPYVAAFVNMLLESGRPVLLYGWHHQVYDLWRDLLKKHNPMFFTGRETDRQKEQAKETFIRGDSKILIMSLRAGAGLDGLQHSGCTDVVFGELDWSPAIHEQAIGRVRRDDLQVPVTGWFMVSEEGSDPVISEVLGVKRGQLDGIRDPNGSVVSGQIDPDAMKNLATAFLARAGIAIPEPPAAAPESLFDGAVA
jgi:SNF2 family DNA or RNA helicase